MTLRELTKLIKERGIEFLNLKFTDLPGQLHHITLPIHQLDDDLLIHGLGFDGSSIRGFQSIADSDMLIKPVLETAFIDPFFDDPTISFICNVKDPKTLALYSRDPRHIAQKAERYVQNSRIADKVFFAPEAEFYIFDNIKFHQTSNEGFYHIDSEEGPWNTGKEGLNLGHKPPQLKKGYFPAPPNDSLHNLRSKMCQVLESVGVEVELHHHEVGSAGQGEIAIKYDRIVRMADKVMKHKYTIKNVAKRYNKTVTFMPKPIFLDNGSGMHVHQSLWKDGKNLFFDPNGYAGLSDIARYYIGGLIHHASSILAFCAPTTNSYRRLVPGYEAPIYLVYSQRNRSAAIRIPAGTESEGAKRIEFRPPDPSANPYLAFSAILMAGIDGIQNKIEPPPPVDRNIYALSDEERQKLKAVPTSLEEALDALEKDHEFLLKGEVFTQDLIDMWINYKRKSDIEFVKLRPHPAEFILYYDI